MWDSQRSVWLARSGVIEDRSHVTLDDSAVLAVVKSVPSGFVAGLRGQVVIAEVQRAPEIFPAIEASVDRDRRPGRFLPTGSTNVDAGRCHT